MSNHYDPLSWERPKGWEPWMDKRGASNNQEKSKKKSSEAEYSLRDMEKELLSIQYEYEECKRKYSKIKNNHIDFRVMYLVNRNYIAYCVILLLATIFIVKVSWAEFNEPIYCIMVGISKAVIFVVLIDLCIVLIKSILKLKRDIKNKQEAMVEQEEALKGLDAKIRLREEIIESAKAAQVAPSRVVNKAKQPTVISMEQSLTSAKERIKSWEGTQEVYAGRLSKILGKCSKLIEVCKGDTMAVNEISNIYNVLIVETLGVVERYSESESSTGELGDMLNNFEDYIDRKLSKYQSMQDIARSCDIAALNKVFNTD